MQSKQQSTTIEANIKSPCINVCKLDEFMVCIGCKRHIDEIAEWTKMSNWEKQLILDRLLI